MDDIVERLLAWSETPNEGDPMIDALLADVPAAAAEIQSLRTQLKERDGLLDRVKALREACKAAEQFIENGVEFGYIRMPTDCPNDSANKTLPIIRQALNSQQGKGQ